MHNEVKDLNGLLARLEILEAEAEIRRLISAHQWASDAGTDGSEIPDWTVPPGVDGQDSVTPRWAEGGQWRGSGLSRMFEGNELNSHGRKGGFTAPRTSWMPHMMHFLTNEYIKVESPTEAIGRWYSWEAATVVVDGADLSIWIAGRYDAKFLKADGRWLISEMHFQEVFSTPFKSGGWSEQPHVAYGPGQVVDSARPK